MKVHNKLQKGSEEASRDSQQKLQVIHISLDYVTVVSHQVWPDDVIPPCC